MIERMKRITVFCQKEKALSVVLSLRDLGLMHIKDVAQPHGLTPADREAWLMADATLPWREPLSTPEYWSMMEEKLL